MTFEPRFFDVEREGAIVIWKFCNPPNNLWNDQTGPELMHLMQDFYADASLHVAVFTSALPDIFIQHYDVSLLVQRGEEFLKSKPEGPVTRRPGFVIGSKPIIAAINAPLSGGGLETALRFDFRFMSRTAWASQSEVNAGILPGGGGTQRILRLVGLARALDLMETGRRVFADEAERIGLITRACDPEKLMPEVMQYARELAARPPKAVHHIRQCIYQGMDNCMEDGLAIESELFRELLYTREALERMKNYVARGQPSAREMAEMERNEAIQRFTVKKAKKLV
ncbi:MAG: enoyl-CoA hydratase/isomerase family protein [Dehalococcoidales bacterium]|nr:enoyl-CoA hydratase/isomerase family protein [Dehalococcoidales bacterium]